ncbi:MAG: LuxR C-terminal-related transcriptional regulator [Actinomycetota bacterium]
MGRSVDLAAAREAFEGRDWRGARELFTGVREQGTTLTADDVYALAECAWWLGLIDEALSDYEAAYRLYLHGEQPGKAAGSALDLAISLFLRGDEAMGSGWMRRAQRLLEDQPEGVEHGYLLYFGVEGALGGTVGDGVREQAQQVQEFGRRHHDPNLVAVGVLSEGRVLIKRGHVAEGMALLDEAMLAALSDELAPAMAGNIYCNLISACHELADIRRAGEWVEATEDWCERLPDAVLFTGICRVHRAQLLHLQGSWDRAEREAARVCEDLAEIHVASVAEAHYEIGEIHRLRGDLAEANGAYARAHGLGRDPQPGLALLRLAEGRIQDAVTSVRAALAALADEPLPRAPLCAAQVEIALAIGDGATARAASEELDRAAVTYGTSGLRAAALRGRGAVLLGEGNATEALPPLREALALWHDLGAPHDAARVRELLAVAYTAMGDADAAGREYEAATTAYARLGAKLDAERVAAHGSAGPPIPGGLTDREVEVLSLVATGRTNRDVADVLVLSEKTVARHLSNIFAKLGVSSRTEAAAFAFQHGLAARRRG